MRIGYHLRVLGVLQRSRKHAVDVQTASSAIGASGIIANAVY